MPKLNKDEIRKALLAKRSQLSAEDQQKLSQRIVHNIKETELFRQAEHVAFYHAVRGEANPAQLMQSTSANTSLTKTFYLPILSPDKSRGLEFAPINKDTQYENNQFQIPEPKAMESNFVDKESLDIVIMPLLGFDLKGNRLGMGGGFYDRSFAFKLRSSQPIKPILIGFAYDFQNVDSLESESWDVGLDAVATENEFISFS